MRTRRGRGSAARRSTLFEAWDGSALWASYQPDLQEKAGDSVPNKGVRDCRSTLILCFS